MIQRNVLVFATCLFLALPLVGCGTQNIGDSLSGGATMRVEVEVYKGPLSKELPAQIGELKAIVDQATNKFKGLNDLLLALSIRNGFLDAPPVSVPWAISKEAYNTRMNLGSALSAARLEIDNRIKESRNDDKDRKKVEEIDKAYQALGLAIDRFFWDASSLAEGIGSEGKAASLAHLRDILKNDKLEFDAKRKDLEDKVGGCTGKAYKVTCDLIVKAEAAGVMAETALSDNSSLDKAITQRQQIYQNRKRPLLDMNTQGTGEAGSTSVVKSVQSRLPDELQWCASEKIRNRLLDEPLAPSEFGQCMAYAHLFKDASELIKDANELKDKNPSTSSLEEYAKLAGKMKVKAFVWAETHAVAAPDSREFRIMITDFANMASEFGNQIASRADTILQQCRIYSPTAGCTEALTSRDRLPLSVYLREINPTAFLNLYIHNRAMASANSAEMITRSPFSLGSEESTDRIRSIEMLFADHNWSRINDVFASGRGKTRMAFIKDEVGNWNLKSFDADPSELLKGYTAIAQATASATVELIKASTGPGAATTMEKGLELASRFGKGRLGPPAAAAGVYLESLKQVYVKRIEALKNKGRCTATNTSTGCLTNEDFKQKLSEELESYRSILNDLAYSSAVAADK